MAAPDREPARCVAQAQDHQHREEQVDVAEPELDGDRRERDQREGAQRVAARQPEQGQPHQHGPPDAEQPGRHDGGDRHERLRERRRVEVRERRDDRDGRVVQRLTLDQPPGRQPVRMLVGRRAPADQGHDQQQARTDRGRDDDPDRPPGHRHPHRWYAQYTLAAPTRQPNTISTRQPRPTSPRCTAARPHRAITNGTESRK